MIFSIGRKIKITSVQFMNFQLRRQATGPTVHSPIIAIKFMFLGASSIFEDKHFILGWLVAWYALQLSLGLHYYTIDTIHWCNFKLFFFLLSLLGSQPLLLTARKLRAGHQNFAFSGFQMFTSQWSIYILL